MSHKETDLRERERSRSTHSRHNRTRRHTPGGAHAHKWRAHTTTPTELGPGYHALSARRASKRESSSSSSGRAGVWGRQLHTDTPGGSPVRVPPPHKGKHANAQTHKHEVRARPPARGSSRECPARSAPSEPRTTSYPRQVRDRSLGGSAKQHRSPPRCSRSNMLSRSSRSGVHDPLLRRSPGGPCRGRSARRQGREPGVEPQRATPRRRGQVVRCGRQVFLGHP